MRIKNDLDVKFVLTASWGDTQHDDLTVVFKVDIENTVWKEIVSYYPLLDELYNSLEDNPLSASLQMPAFPPELIDNYPKLVQVLSPDYTRRAQHEELLEIIIQRLEQFIGGLLANLPLIPAEPKAICKQMFFRSLHKIQVFECLLGNTWKKNGLNPLSKAKPDSKELAMLKQVLSSKTEADLLQDALEGVRAEMAMQNIVKTAAATSPTPTAKAEVMDITVDNLGADFQDVRVSVLSPHSPLMAALHSRSPSPACTPKQDLSSLGLTDLDVAASMADLRMGVACQFLLPDKAFHGRLCQATLILPEDMYILDISLVINTGKKTQSTRLIYDIKVDVGMCYEGKGPTLLGYPEDISAGRLFHVTLHNRPELNFVVEDEHLRNKLMVAINTMTAGLRSTVQAVTRQSTVASSYITRQSTAKGRPPLAPGTSTSNFPSPADEGDRHSDASDASKLEDEEVASVPFSMPMKVLDFSWGHVLTKPGAEAGSSDCPRLANRERLPVSQLLAEPLKLIIASSLNELLVFTLPPSWTSASYAKVKEMDAVLKNLKNVPFPINLFEKKKIVCEQVVYSPGIMYMDEKQDVMFLASEDVTMNIYVEDIQYRMNIMSCLLQGRKARLTPLNISPHSDNGFGGTSPTFRSSVSASSPRFSTAGSPTNVLRSSVSSSSPRAIAALS